MQVCPKCHVPLQKALGPPLAWECASCGGKALTLASLRKQVPAHIVNALWQSARSDRHPKKRFCPSCKNFMTEVPVHSERGIEHLDICASCQVLWFDPNEYEALPAIPETPAVEKPLPLEARKMIALMDVKTIAEKACGKEWGYDPPEETWKWIAGFLRLPVEQDIQEPAQPPWLTWSLALLIAAVSFAAFADLERAVESFGLVPAEAGRKGGLTLLTSFFLHGSVFHLLFNLYFFLVFGDNVEDALGKGRFLLLLAVATIAGDGLHILGDPRSVIPCIGASGGISGIIAFYALKFPRARMGFMIRMFVYFRWIRMPAYAMFIIWVAIQMLGVWQQLQGFSNISALAHLGGAFAGFAFWLFAGRKNESASAKRGRGK